MPSVCSHNSHAWNNKLNMPARNLHRAGLRVQRARPAQRDPSRRVCPQLRRSEALNTPPPPCAPQALAPLGRRARARNALLPRRAPPAPAPRAPRLASARALGAPRPPCAPPATHPFLTAPSTHICILPPELATVLHGKLHGSLPRTEAPWAASPHFCSNFIGLQCLDSRPPPSHRPLASNPLDLLRTDASHHAALSISSRC